MSDGPGSATEYASAVRIVQEILSLLPGGCTWLVPEFGPDGQLVDFRVAAAGDQGRDIYGRGAGRLKAMLTDLYPSMVDGPLWNLYQRVLATGVSDRMTDFRYEENTSGIVAESLFDVMVHPLLGGLLVLWQRVDEDRRRLEHTERLGRLGWAEYDLVTGVSNWSPGMYSIFDRDPALGPMSRAEQGAALLAEDRGISEAAWQTLDSGGPSDVTVRFQLSDTVQHLRILSEVARDATGSPLKVYALVQDVTAREATRTEIERLRDQLLVGEMTALAEHRLAVQLQNMIQPIPAEPVSLPGVEAMVRYLPAESAIQVGGDWYHAQALPDGQVVLAIGDVAGHGLSAASEMARLRYSLVAWLSIDVRDPGILIGYLNRLCVQLKITGTALVAVYDPASRELSWARAGQLPPLLARGGQGGPLGALDGMLLGADVGYAYPVARNRLRADDLLLLYTDGLVERRPVDTVVLTGQLIETLAESSISVDDGTLTSLLARFGEPSRFDDTCVLAVRVLA
jgi:serine phosphatase RsbU (regulator of sigma subunit)